MSISQVLDRTFSLYRSNFVLFAGIAAVPPALLMLGQFGLLALPRFLRFSGLPGLQIAAIISTVVVGAALLVLWLIGYALATGASVYAVSRLHLGYQTSIAESYRLIRPYTGTILGLVILVFLVVAGVVFAGIVTISVPVVLVKMAGGGGTPAASGTVAIVTGLVIILVLPAVFVLALYFSAKFSLAVPACVVEHLNASESLRRSWNLAKGSTLRLILVNFLAAIIAFAIGAVLSIPYFVGVGMFAARKDPGALLPFVMWQYVADFLGRSIAFPIATIAVSLIYYDERVRKEAFDLQLMMEAIGQAQPAPLQGQVSSTETPIG